MKIVENKINDDVILSNHILNDKETIRAYSKMVKKLSYKLAIYKRALELACEEIDANSKGLTNARFKIQKIVNDWCIGEQMSIFDFFLQQAKKELEEEDESN